LSPWEGKAYPHQIEGAETLALSGKGILGDKMGLGKTLTSLIWLDKVNAKKTLLTGPKEITSNLRREVPKWTDRPVFDLRGYKKNQRETLFSLLEDFDEYICIINIESWRKDHSLIEKLIALQLDSIIVDEAHHLNNESTLNYKGLREIRFAVNTCPRPTCGALLKPRYTCRRSNCSNLDKRFLFRYCLSCGHIATRVVIPPCSECGTPDAARKPWDARSVKNVLCMTATVVLNNPENLFPLLHLTDHERFTTARRYLDEYCKKHGTENKYVWKDEGRERLARDIAPYYVARSLSDTGITLPPQSIEVREYDFDTTKYRDQWEAYKKIETEFRLELMGETLGITEVVTQLLRLRQMLVWPNGIELRDPVTKEVVDYVNIGASYKLDIVERLANEFLESGERIVVFSHFKAPLRELAKRLGSDSVVYDGSTSDTVRQDIRHDFGPESTVAGYQPRWRAALCNYRSAGEGLNLVGATQAIILDEEWSPGKNQQAYGRIHRIGQQYKTGIHIPRILNTVDEWMAELNEFKQTLVDGFEETVSLNKKLREVVGK
jgi:SNF2 family DNA or RNA helicase